MPTLCSARLPGGQGMPSRVFFLPPPCGDGIEDRVLWLATAIVHHANRVRPNPGGLKVGGHQASSASMVSIMTSLWFGQLRAEDRVSVKPHASPVLHAINYLLGELDEKYLPTCASSAACRAIRAGPRIPIRPTTRPARSVSARPRRSGARCPAAIHREARP